MKATELRIGNCVLEDGREIELSVYGLVDIDKNMQSTYLPIPLTEEWLKRFGFFKERKRPSRYHRNFFSIEFNDSNIVLAYAPFRKDWGFYIEYTDSPDPKDNKTKYFVSCGIKYVHQLQNLYFALAGEELKLSEE